MSFKVPQKAYELAKKYDVSAPRYTSYPTAPVWTSSFGPKEYSRILSTLNSEFRTPNLSLYFHIPFCERRCAFCGCSTIATPKHEAADRYIAALGSEMDIVASHISGPSPVVQLHLGGGTPTYLTCKQIEELWEQIVSRFTFHEDAEIGIEIDPRVTSHEQLKLLASLGFNRVSLGVQDLSPEVQEAIGRTSSLADIRAMVDECRHVGFKSVNIDLIYGLPRQTLSSFRATIKKIIGLSPDRIACFNFAYLPKMLPHQRILQAAVLPDAATKFSIFCMAIEMLTGSGYDFIGMDHFAKKDDELSVAAREKTIWRNFQGYTTKSGTDLLGFGMTSISDAGGCYAQNAKKLSDYYRAVENGRLATARGWRLTEDDLLRRKIIRDLFCNGDAKEKGKGNRGKVSELERDGLVRLDGDDIIVTSLGRLFIRNIAMAFDAYLGNNKGSFSRAV